MEAWIVETVGNADVINYLYQAGADTIMVRLQPNLINLNMENWRHRPVFPCSRGCRVVPLNGLTDKCMKMDQDKMDHS